MGQAFVKKYNNTIKNSWRFEILGGQNSSIFVEKDKNYKVIYCYIHQDYLGPYDPSNNNMNQKYEISIGMGEFDIQNNTIVEDSKKGDALSSDLEIVTKEGTETIEIIRHEFYAEEDGVFIGYRPIAWTVVTI